MRLARRPALAFVLLAGLAALPAVSRATDAGVPFSEQIDVRLVNVEVVVEERGGRRVTGLGAESFRLRVDGQPVELSHFAEVRRGRTVEPRADGPSPPAALAGAGAVPNSYLVYIDDYFSIGAHRNLALDQLRRQIDRVRAPDRMAIVAFGGRDLELLAAWTDDRGVLRDALEAAKGRPTFGLLRFAERLRQGIPVVGSATGDFFYGEAEYELGRTAAALQATLHGFASAPGRKIAIVLSGGWPSLDAGLDTSRTFANRYENDLEILAPVFETANLLGFTLYPVDLPGLRPSETTRIVGGEGFDVSWRATAGDRGQPDENVAAIDPRSSFEYGQRFDTFFPRRTDFFPEPNEHREILRQSALRVLGRETGGRALLGSDRARALAEIVEDTGSYYWLAFRPDRAFDDRLHKIRVEVDGDYKVRSRRGFRDLSPQATAEHVTLGAALVRQAELADELEVALGSARRVGRREVEVPLTIRIPADRVVFLPTQDGHAARLELRLAAVAAADRHTEVPLIPVVLRVNELPPAGGMVPFQTVVTVPRRAHTLAVSLFDTVGGRVLLATADLPR